MELVPIIYTALIIFAVLAVTTILISYLLYKVKGNDQSDDENERDSLMSIQPELIKPGEKKLVKASSPRQRSSGQKKAAVRPKDKKKPSNKKSKSKPDPIKDNKRIKILNSISPAGDKKQVTQANKAIIKSKTKPGATDIKYSDDDSEFFILDTSRKKMKN